MLLYPHERGFTHRICKNCQTRPVVMGKDWHISDYLLVTTKLIGKNGNISIEYLRNIMEGYIQ